MKTDSELRREVERELEWDRALMSAASASA
jgi:hypothetical protein